jgi:transposase InsO family protein
MDQKIEFIADYKRYRLSFTELCESYGVSRKTGYKWVERYLEEGPAALEDRSRASDRHPNQTPEKVVQALLEAHRQHEGWGAKKLLWAVEQRHPKWELCHPSTVYDILRRHGEFVSKRRRRRPGHPGKPTTSIAAPNAVWSADFKGQFRMGNGQYCYPLTLTDNFSRYLLCCHGQLSTNLDETMEAMKRVFLEYGLPDRIRTDNGVPFASEALGRLSRLSAWWIRLGVTPELIEPGKPQQNGRHERMHKTLKAATTRPPGSGLRSQQRKFDEFQQEYNHERPHESLGMKPPATAYQKARRQMPTKLPDLEYPAHYERRYVSGNGGIRWNGDWVNVSSVCIGHDVGLEEIDDGLWNVYFGNFRLGRFHERHMRIEDIYGRLIRK